MKQVVRRLVPVLVLLAQGCSSHDSDHEATSPVERADAAMPDADSAAPLHTDAGRDLSMLQVTVTGPISGGMGKPFTTSVVDLAAHDYRESEFFYEGDASAFAPQGELSKDGKWTIEEISQAHFKSRMLVRRPADAAKFNGTVIIEWLNVSGGADGDPGYMYNWQEILREGYAWVGVSAQATGVSGGGFSLLPGLSMPLVQYDPARYGSLNHPGDVYSYDIYTRAAQIVRGAGDVDVLDGLEPKRLIAYGESQSAFRLVSYVDGVQPRVNVFDGFFIHSRGASGAPFSDETAPSLGGAPMFIRDDIAEPVFQFQTETDVLGMLAYLPARQPDNDRLRTWEVAGTAHADAYILTTGSGGGPSLLPCTGVNDGPQQFVIKAALHALNRWLVDGTAPPAGAVLEADDSGKPLKDEHGNTRGGVRTPDVDVPIATLSGSPADGVSSLLCGLFGSMVPLPADQLMSLYPDHADYVRKVKDSASRTRAAGFMLEPEAQAMIAEAEAAHVPN